MDEWIFRLHLSGENSLRRSQPAVEVEASTEPPASERESLLESSSSAPALGGWTLESPFWKLTSQNLLQVVFCPAWQTIPEYTASSACSRSLSRIVTCGCHAQVQSPSVDYVQQIWTTKDVVKVEKVPALEIKGVGRCLAMRIHLQPLAVPSSWKTPSHLQSAWDRHVSHMQDSGDTMSTPDAEGPVLVLALSPDTDAPLLWKVELPNTATVGIETITVLDGKLLEAAPTHIYINGYQSWSFTGSIVKGQETPQPAVPAAYSAAFNRGAMPPPEAQEVIGSIPDDSVEWKYQSDFFTCLTADTPTPSKRPHLKQHFWPGDPQFPYQQLDETGGPALIVGWLSQRKQFGLIRTTVDLTRLQMHVSCQHVMVHGVTGPIVTDWAFAQLLSPHSYDEEPLVHYLHAVAGNNSARPLQNGSLLTGWCSWYHYYENIEEETLRTNFAKLAAMRTKVPTNVAVVDDGYMTAWGDWDSLKPGKFGHGLGGVAEDIAEYGMRPGLWLAPYAADKFSMLASEHPDWTIRNHAGAIANSSHCGKWFCGLDASNPQVREHVFRSIRRAVHDWKYNVLKIDFLYAACLHGNGKYDLSMSRAKAMDIALDTIRQAAGPDVFLIGCGCPVASAIGYVDGMRVSCDTGPTWRPAFPLPSWDHGTLPSLRGMLRNSITRAPLGHRFWHNDPDCLLLGESTRLTDDEVASAASIVAMTCGMMLLSDDLTKVSANRMHILTKIFPMTGVSAVVLDLHSTNDGLPSLLRLWCTDRHDIGGDLVGDDDDYNAEATFFARQASFHPDAALPAPDERSRSCIHVAEGLGTWTVVSISNWFDKAAVVHVPPPALLPPPIYDQDYTEATSTHGDFGGPGYHVLAFWSSRYSWLPDPVSARDKQGPQHALSKRLAAHATEIFHIKKVTPDEPQYLGSDIHFSCGREVRSFDVSGDTISIQMKTKHHRAGHIFVFVPRTNTDNIRVTVNGESGRWNAVGNTPKVSENGSPRLVGRVIRVAVIVRANGTPNDGIISIAM